MATPIEVTCPDCKVILIIDRITGKVLETRRPIVEESSGDRFEDALSVVRSSKEAAEAKFLEAQQKERERKEKLESLFNESLKSIQQSGEDVGPITRDIDLD